MIFKIKNLLDKSGGIEYNINIKEGDRCVAAPELILITACGCNAKAVIFYLLYFFRLLK